MQKVLNNQTLKFKTTQNSKNLRLNGPKPCLCIFVYGSLGRENGCRCDQNT